MTQAILPKYGFSAVIVAFGLDGKGEPPVNQLMRGVRLGFEGACDSDRAS